MTEFSITYCVEQIENNRVEPLDDLLRRLARESLARAGSKGRTALLLSAIARRIECEKDREELGL